MFKAPVVYRLPDHRKIFIYRNIEINHGQPQIGSMTAVYRDRITDVGSTFVKGDDSNPFK